MITITVVALVIKTEKKGTGTFIIIYPLGYAVIYYKGACPLFFLFPFIRKKTINPVLKLV